MECFTKEVGRKVVGRLGNCGKIEIRERAEEDGGLFFCIKCRIDVHKPLRRIIKLLAPVHEEIWGLLDMKGCLIFAFIAALLAII